MRLIQFNRYNKYWLKEKNEVLFFYRLYRDLFYKRSPYHILTDRVT